MAAPTPTEAERALADAFETRAKTFTEKPLDAARADAFRRFAAAGLPHRRVEAYKYTDLKARLRQLPPAANPADPGAVEAALAAHEPLPGVDGRVVIANGRYVPEVSSAPGATVADILDPAAETDAVGRLIAESDDPLTLANAGLFDGGVVIHVAETAPAFEIVHVVSEAATVMPRSAIFVASGATVTIAERVVAAEGAVFNALSELTLEANAHARLIRVAHGADEGATDLASLHVRLAEHAVLDHITLSTGKGLYRGQAFVHVAGDEAAANFRTATVALGKRHSDTTLVVRHDCLHSTSTEEFRSAVGDGGASIVQGRIVVDPDAQKTDARMMSRGLFLDDTGEVVNKPELEIFADDVQCGHGATAGDLDEDMVFYLRARGIPEAEARRLLVDAFLVEALDLIEDEGLSEALSAHLRAALEGEAR